MHIPIIEENLTIYDEYTTYKNLMVYTPPFIIFFGTVGNILSFVILTRRPMKQQSTYKYLAVLSVTDTLVLYIGLLRVWIRELTGYDLQNKYDWSCSLIAVLNYVVSHYSVWLIIAVTVERYIAVCHPLRAPAIANKYKAYRVIFGILIILVVINLHPFWTLDVGIYLLREHIITLCQSANGYEKLNGIWPWVDAFIYTYIPAVLVSVFNGLIICELIKSKRQRRRLCAGNRNTNRPSSNIRRSRMSVNRNQRASTSENSLKVTVMLLAVSFAFLITTLPMNSLLIIKVILGEHRNPRRFAMMRLITSVTELLMYLNHSMNFVLYCATGEKFRQQLVALLCPRHPRRLAGGDANIPMENLHNASSFRAGQKISIRKANQRPVVAITHDSANNHCSAKLVPVSDQLRSPERL